jgi:hypothetical protein
MELKKRRIATVLFDYESDVFNEITCYEGNLIELITLGEDGWSEVRLIGEDGIPYGRVGLFPNDYFEEINEEVNEKEIINNNDDEKELLYNNNEKEILNNEEEEEEEEEKENNKKLEIKKEENIKEEKIKKEEAIKIIKNQILKKLTFEKYKNYMNSNIFKQSYNRLYLMKEIYETEKSYIDFLREIKIEYIDPIKKESILDEKDANEIFLNIEEIIRVNTNFFIEIEKEYLKFPNSYFCNIFIKHIKNFEIYKGNNNNIIK